MMYPTSAPRPSSPWIPPVRPDGGPPSRRLPLPLLSLLLLAGALAAVGCGDDESSVAALVDCGFPPDQDSGDLGAQEEPDLGPQDEPDLGPEPLPGCCCDAEERMELLWGPAPDLDTRVAMFEDLWSRIAWGYACFEVVPVDWQALHDELRPRVEAAESYGRFYQILDEMVAAVHDSHTVISSQRVCSTPARYRPPRFDRRALTSRIGACATLVDGEDLLVYRVEDDNPAGLLPGDLLLGYDGLPWRELLDRIDSWKLPACGSPMSADWADDAERMASLVNNAHLFTTLDVERHASEGPSSIPTADLLDYEGLTACSDQLPVEGVPFPWESYADYGSVSHVSWGVLPGTNIGFIYLYSQYGSWTDLPLALADLMDTDALVIDQRLNHGGWPTPEAFGLLFGEDADHLYNCAERAFLDPDWTRLDPIERDWYFVEADPELTYEGPIAVLTGPHAASGGDLFPYTLSMLPNVRRFGRPTQGSFGATYSHWTPDPWLEDLSTRYTGCMFIDPDGNAMQASVQEPEEPLWLTQEDVMAGKDTVVEAALGWIEGELAAE